MSYWKLYGAKIQKNGRRHNVWNHQKCLIWIFRFWYFSSIFCYYKSDLSSNTVWLQTSDCQIVTILRRISLSLNNFIIFDLDFYRFFKGFYSTIKTDGMILVLIFLKLVYPNNNEITYLKDNGAVFENYSKCLIWFWNWPVW